MPANPTPFELENKKKKKKKVQKSPIGTLPSFSSSFALGSLEYRPPLIDLSNEQQEASSKKNTKSGQIREYRCIDCGKCFQSKYNLDRHSKTHQTSQQQQLSKDQQNIQSENGNNSNLLQKFISFF